MKIRRGIAALLACVATSAMILVATPLSARADDPLINDTQHLPLINIGSAKCFEPTGLPIQQHACSPNVIHNATYNDRPIQWYQFQSQGHVAYNDQGWCARYFGCITEGATGYLISNMETKLCFDVRDGSKSDSAVVQQSTCNKNARSMFWYVQPSDFPGMFKVRNFHSDRCLDVKGGSSAEGAQLQQFHCNKMNLAQSFSQKFPPFWPLGIDLNGRWTDGSTQNGTTRCCVVIFSGLGSIAIDMSAFNRRDAHGRYFAPSSFSINFPDDRDFGGDVSPTSQIGLHGPMAQFGRRNLESQFALPNFEQTGADARGP